MKKFEWNIEGGITKSTTNTVEDLLVNSCFTKLKELKCNNNNIVLPTQKETQIPSNNHYLVTSFYTNLILLTEVTK